MTNDKSGLKALTALLQSQAPDVSVVETTGQYHRPCHRHLHAAGFCVAVMNPLRTHKFADMMGQLAKTDEIDARTLALFGAMVKPKTTPPPIHYITTTYRSELSPATHVGSDSSAVLPSYLRTAKAYLSASHL